MENALHYIELSKDPITFDSVSQLTNVFFDDSNRQVILLVNLKFIKNKIPALTRHPSLRFSQSVPAALPV